MGILHFRDLMESGYGDSAFPRFDGIPVMGFLHLRDSMESGYGNPAIGDFVESGLWELCISAI